MDDDLDKVSGIDSGVESEINDETIDKNKYIDDSGGFFSGLSKKNYNQGEIPCEKNEIYNAELNQYRNKPKLPIKYDRLPWWKEHKHMFTLFIDWQLDFFIYLQLLHPMKEYGTEYKDSLWNKSYVWLD